MRLPGIIPRNGSERFGRDAEMDEAVDRLVTDESATIHPEPDSSNGAGLLYPNLRIRADLRTVDFSR